ncbi:MAG TPA: alpha/beta fold hydrolase [Candidatus Polarisedimenticolaceae bacterium]|nr:alpha/beta fold hydrolase [Candidatus Polarisedimenticolaceae bacterium]
MKLYCRIEGSGFPVIILHGLLGSSDNWRAISKRLSQSYKVFTVDLRNHGQSPHSETMKYPAMADDVRELLEIEKVSDCHLVGHSLGGKVAMQFAASHPDLVSKLISVDIAPKAYPPFQRAILAALQQLELQSFRSFGEIDAALAPAIPEAPMRQFLMKNIARLPSAGFQWRIDLDSIAKNYDQLTKPIIAAASYDKPALFVRGGRSDYIADTDLSSIRALFTSAELVTIETSGHWVHAEATDEFLRILTEFLNQP